MADIRHTMSLDDQRFAAAIDRSNRRVSRMARRMRREMGMAGDSFDRAGGRSRAFGLRSAASMAAVVVAVRTITKATSAYYERFPEFEDKTRSLGKANKDLWVSLGRDVEWVTDLFAKGVRGLESFRGSAANFTADILAGEVGTGAFVDANRKAAEDAADRHRKRLRDSPLINSETARLGGAILDARATDPRSRARAQGFSEKLRAEEDVARIKGLDLEAGAERTLMSRAKALHLANMKRIHDEATAEINEKGRVEREGFERGAQTREQEEQRTRERVRDQRREFTDQSDQAKIRLRSLRGDEQGAKVARERLDLERRIRDVQGSDLPEIEKKRLIEFDRIRTQSTIDALGGLSGPEKKQDRGRSIGAGSVSDEFTRKQVLGPLRTNPVVKAAKTAESTLAEQKKTNKKLTEISAAIKQSGGQSRYG